MGFPTKVQLIKRQASEQWYINFPSALAQAMDFSRGETVEWTVEDKSLLALRRLHPPPHAKKNSASILSAFQQLWQRMPPRLRPAARRRARPNALVEQPALLGSPHRDRIVDHLRVGVPGLVGGVSSLLPPPLARRRRLRRHPPRGPRRVACRGPLLASPSTTRCSTKPASASPASLGAATRSALTSRPISCAPSASCSSPPQSLCLTARTA